MIVLDTNVVSELLRPVPARQVVDWLALQDGATV
ncbi:MAG TPA: VapC toxin family PIN domain ribonuclease, partial [Chloroflexi bacterium]|nr:VapC toxin family PIN domain ribonuclease [Chloroflexota bacterium]